ncbi:MAG: DUF4111 domain-containing protein [Clostridia bacterium]|nr:DUF4111 domain-containing protein [Clostridia bacterium]
MDAALQHAIRRMTDEICRILADCVPAVYLYGSAAGDYRHGWSDIDLLVLTGRPMTDIQAGKLLMLRQTLQDAEPETPFYRSFEGGMIDLEAFLNRTDSRAVYWGTSGQRITAQYAMDCFSLRLLHEHGVLLYGPDVRSCLPCPDTDELLHGVQEHLRAIRIHGQGGRSLYTFGWMLDIARGLYTAETGCVAAKTAAGEWALNQGLCPEAQALRLALRVRQDPSLKQDASVLARAEMFGPAIQAFADVLEEALERRGLPLRFR